MCWGWWHGRVVLGLVMRGNYPATDQVIEPGRCSGELGIVVLIRVYWGVERPGVLDRGIKGLRDDGQNSKIGGRITRSIPWIGCTR